MILSPRPSDNKLILCVDDGEYNLHLHNVRESGYTVLTARSRGQGLRLLAENHVNFVILDSAMSKTNVDEVAREIKRTHPHVAILMLSGQIDAPDSSSSAADAIVAKQQSPEVLLTYLAVLSEEGRGRRRLGKLAA